MEFQKIVDEVLTEDITAGGASSAYGPNVGATASSTSGDNLAAGDARSVYGSYSGVMTRRGFKKHKAKNKKNKRKS
jgi:hypothetical protein